MAEILVEVTSWLLLLPRISVGNVLETMITSSLAYEPLVRAKNTGAWNLLRGLLVILVSVLFAAVPHLITILWILESTATIAVATLLAIFQPGLRKVLEQLGSRNYIPCLSSFDEDKDNQDFNDKAINELVRATLETVEVKTGALVMIEHDSSLKEIEGTGIKINGLATSQLLVSIFEYNTPLHDGAVVIKGNRIATATCYLSLTDNVNISRDLGTRHRTAVGVSKSTGNTTIMVSEETGRVSVIEGGVLSRIPDAESLKKVLSSVEEETISLDRLKIWRGKPKSKKKAV